MTSPSSSGTHKKKNLFHLKLGKLFRRIQLLEQKRDDEKTKKLDEKESAVDALPDATATASASSSH
jgi:hypothetical protein